MGSTIFISAGEASGEQYGALLMAALKRQLAAAGQAARFVGMGGPRMAAEGLDCIVRAEEMAVMGVTEVILHLPRIYRGYRKLHRSIAAAQQDNRPDVAVLIDFPDVHFKLAREFHRLGIPVIFFVSPQLWAWKKHRIELVRKFVRRMLVIFPFEESFYKERGVEAEFVGHPLAELSLPPVNREQFAAENGLDAGRTWIALLPGSRMREIRHNLPEMLKAARKLSLPGQGAAHLDQSVLPDRYEFLIPLAPTLTAGQRAEVFKMTEDKMAEDKASALAVRMVDDARAAMLLARASVVASGTATVEAALIGNPFVVVYRVSPLTYAVARLFVDIPHVAMVNLIAGKRVAPELIQHEFTAANIVRQLAPLLPDGHERQSMMQELKGIREALTAPPRQDAGQDAAQAPGSVKRVAAIVLEQMETASPAHAARASQF